MAQAFSKWLFGSSGEDENKQIKDLLAEIRKLLQKSSTHRGIETLRIVLCGAVNAGKSSLVNNILSAFNGSIVHPAPVGNMQGHVTGKYTEYKANIPNEGRGTTQTHLVLCDTQGFDKKTPEDNVDAVRAAVEGYYFSSQDMRDKQTVDAMRAQSARKKQAVYIIFVVDSTRVGNKKDDRSLMIESIQIFAQNESIPYSVFLTKCDRLDAEVDKDKQKLYKSAKVDKARTIVQADFNGMPKNRIFPIVNYTDQKEFEPQMRLQTLRALIDVLRDVESYVSSVIRHA